VYAVLEARLKAQEANSGMSSLTSPNLITSNQDQGEGFSSVLATNESPAMMFARSIRHWATFPDSTDALARLAKHFKLVVLSNVDNESFGWTHELLSLGSAQETKDSPGLYSYPAPNPNKFWHPQETTGSKSPFAAILTAQDVGCYMPSLSGFHIASHPDLFGAIDGSQDEVKEKVLCVAQSLRYDIEPANQLGLRSVWIDRQDAVTYNEAARVSQDGHGDSRP
jgi:FMN phosphatase YigB (HAD superfamily)